MGMSNAGRPTLYNEELADEICRRIMDGESLKHITSGDDMPSRSSVHLWLATNSLFSDKYARAKEDQADTLTDDMEDIARDIKIDVKRARLIIDTRKWAASKLKPKKYGDKIDMTSDGEKLGVTLSADQADQLIRARAERSAS